MELVEECLGTVGDGGEEVVDRWDVDILWQIGAPTGAPSAINSYSQPVVGNLDDDNGDGLIDESDDPDVVMLAFGGSPYSVVVALEGATGADKWGSAGGNLGVSFSSADVDVDGAPDVVTFDTSRYLQVFEGDGSLKYTSTTAVSSAYYPLAVIADLDEDGLPEVVGDEIVFNGEDGSVDFSLTGACGSILKTPRA